MAVHIGKGINGIVAAAGIFSTCQRCDHTCLVRQDLGKPPAHTGAVILPSDSSCERIICLGMDRSSVRACSEEGSSESGEGDGEGQV
jgi:hypothetical protein